MTIWCPNVEAQEPPIYQAIAKALADDIRLGQLRAGDRLPTHRELADQMGVARGTITRAYTEAERMGLVRSEIGRGTFVCPVREADDHPLPSLRQPTNTLIDLSVNYPVYSEDPDLNAMTRELSRSPDLDQLLRYQSYLGMPRHRATGATWARRHGATVTEDQILLTNGSQHALNVIFSTLCEPGDLIVTDEVTYPGIKAIAKLLNLRLFGLPIDKDGFDPEAFESACLNRPVRALYCMPTIQNPTTVSLSFERRKRIAQIAKTHGVLIVEDDVHRLYNDDPPPTLFSLAPDQTLFIASTGKEVAGGLRVAYLASPAAFVERLGLSVWATTGLVPPLCAEIATRWIEDGTADRTVARKRKETQARSKIATEMLADYEFLSQPDAMFLWLTLPAAWDSAEFAVEARRRGVGVTPAGAFLVDGRPAPCAVRICLGAARDQDQLRQGLRLILRTLKSDPGSGPAIV